MATCSDSYNTLKTAKIITSFRCQCAAASTNGWSAIQVLNGADVHRVTSRTNCITTKSDCPNVAKIDICLVFNVHGLCRLYTVELL